MQFCSNCNMNYSDAAQFCPTCGMKLVYRPEKVNRRKVLSILKSLPGYKKIMQDCTIYNYDEKVHFDYIVIHESGIFLFQLYELYRILEGNDKMRYWTGEDWNRDGSIVTIERPVTRLEKDHNIFDQVLRKYTFTKSFAFLIFPADGGLERVKSSYLDQMFTVPRMGAVLVHTINDYGHAYDDSDIDKIFDILSDLVKHEELSPKAHENNEIKRSSPSSFIRIFSALILIAAVTLSIFYILTKRNQSTYLPAIPTYQPSSTISTPVNKANSVLSLSSVYGSLFETCSQSELDQIAAVIGCRGINRQPDGTIQIELDDNSNTQVIDAANSAFTEIITQLFNANSLPDFTSIRIDNHSQFTVFVTSQQQNSNESVIIEEMLRLGVLYAVLENRKPDSFSIVILSQDGQKLNTITPNSFMHR